MANQNLTTMKLKNFIPVFCLCMLCNTITTAAHTLTFNQEEIIMNFDEEDKFIPIKDSTGSRSLTSDFLIKAYQNDDFSIDLEFLETLGEIEITISKDGIIVYSSKEDTNSTNSKRIELPEESKQGIYLLEIKGTDGGYAYGWFSY